MSNSRLALVTGGAGFIGSHLVLTLLARGYRVKVLDNLSGPGSWRRLQNVLKSIEAIEGDIRDTAMVKRAVAGVDTVFHKAALVSVPESVKRPGDYHEVDATGTLQLLEAAVAGDVRRFIYASTSAIYGDAPEQPKVESMRGLPISPYGIAKYAGELYVSAFAKLRNLQTISLRYFNVFGPGQDPKSQYGAAIPSIVSKIIADQRPVIYGNGQQTRDFCHVSNVVHANLLAAEAPRLSGEVVNIGCGVRVSVNRIVQLANELLGKKVESIYESPREGDVMDSLADISAAKKVLGYEPIIHFDEGLRQSIDWYKTQ
jgi:nucleoside-diphosphate-sugar epimerase